MIRRKNFIFIILSSILVLTGCGAEEKKLSDTQSDVQIEETAEEAETADEPEVTEDGGFRELTQEELDTFTQFIHGWDAYGFLLSEYTNPVEADLLEVFYSGAGLQEDMSEEEVAAYLAACDQEELYTNCVKIPRSGAEKLVEERLGLSLEEMDASVIGLYLPEYDAYYRECGDTNYMEFTCVNGLVNGNVYTLEFKADMDYIYSDVQTILEKTEDDYRFISNQSLVESAETSDIITDAGMAWEYLKEAYFSECELEEISCDENFNDFQVVIGRTELAFEDGEEERPCESVIFLDDVDEDYYNFGHYFVFYDGDSVYATQTKGWYWVNRHTGEVSGA